MPVASRTPERHRPFPHQLRAGFGSSIHGLYDAIEYGLLAATFLAVFGGTVFSALSGSPFLAIKIVVLGLIVLVPGLGTWLPGLMGR